MDIQQIADNNPNRTIAANAIEIAPQIAEWIARRGQVTRDQIITEVSAKSSHGSYLGSLVIRHLVETGAIVASKSGKSYRIAA